MKLVIGLGNPGRQYDKTRHNVGFWTIDRLASSLEAGSFVRRWEGLTAQVTVGGEKLILVKPQTYMNLSGRTVGRFSTFYQLGLEDIIVIHDDLDLPQGRLRLRRGGSAGGHNGIKSLIEHLGGTEFTRVKIGIGRPADDRMEARDYVLAQCDAASYMELLEQCDRAVKAVLKVAECGLDAAMNEFNRQP